MNEYLVSYFWNGTEHIPSNRIVIWNKISKDNIDQFEIKNDCVIIAITKLDS